MSLLVRHKNTGNYLQGHCVWTTDPSVAMQFTSGLKLVDYIEHGGVREKAEQIEIIIWDTRTAHEA